MINLSQLKEFEDKCLKLPLPLKPVVPIPKNINTKKLNFYEIIETSSLDEITEIYFFDEQDSYVKQIFLDMIEIKGKIQNERKLLASPKTPVWDKNEIAKRVFSLRDEYMLKLKEIYNLFFTKIKKGCDWLEEKKLQLMEKKTHEEAFYLIINLEKKSISLRRGKININEDDYCYINRMNSFTIFYPNTYENDNNISVINIHTHPYCGKYLTNVSEYPQYRGIQSKIISLPSNTDLSTSFKSSAHYGLIDACEAIISENDMCFYYFNKYIKKMIMDTRGKDFDTILDIIQHNGNRIKTDTVTKQEYQDKSREEIIPEIENRYLHLLGRPDIHVINMSITLLK